MGSGGQKGWGLLVCLAVCLAGSAVFAAGAGPLIITQQQTLNFGAAMKPTSGSVWVVVTRLGVLGPGTTATMIDTSALSAGQDKIKGSGGVNSIQISFDECGSNSGLGLSLDQFRANYDGENFLDSQSGLDAPGGGGTMLTYGARLTINASATRGLKTPCYNIEVDYD